MNYNSNGNNYNLSVLETTLPPESEPEAESEPEMESEPEPEAQAATLPEIPPDVEENEDLVENEYLISQRYNLTTGKTQFYLANRNDTSINGYNLSIVINVNEELHLLGNSDLINIIEIVDNEGNILSGTTSPRVILSGPKPSGLVFMYISPNGADVINKTYYYRKINNTDSSMQGTITWTSS